MLHHPELVACHSTAGAPKPARVVAHCCHVAELQPRRVVESVDSMDAELQATAVFADTHPTRNWGVLVGGVRYSSPKATASAG
eukprot:242889-Amphidinium_carterae.2